MFTKNKGNPVFFVKDVNGIRTHYYGFEINKKRKLGVIEQMNEDGCFVNESKIPKNKKELRKWIIKTVGYVEPTFETDFDEAEKELLGNEICLKENEVASIAANTETRDKIFIAGSTGSGKSWIAADYLTNYIYQTGNKATIISQAPDDPAFDRYDLQADKLDVYERDEDDNFIYIKDPIRVEELENSAVLFDDIAGLQNDNLIETFERLFRDSLDIGRKLGVTVVRTGHIITNGKETRKMLAESTFVIGFPGQQMHFLEYFITTYLGKKFANKILEKILKLQSRWVAFHMIRPHYIIHEKGAIFVDGC